jgi:hypothetical protein
VLVWAGGIVALSGTLTSGQAGILGRVGTASVLVGAAVFIVDFSIDGVAGQDLATAWQAAPPAERPELELAARTAFTILRGTSLTSILILWGIPLLLLGREDLFPGVLLYGLLISILVPLWSLALGLAMWRRATATHG